MTREALTYAELELRVCGLSHGVAPCAASGDKCFNTRATCQDRFNFDLADEPGGVAEYVSSLLNAAPSGATVSFAGVAIEPGAFVALTVSARRAGGSHAIASATIGGKKAEIVVQRASGGNRSAVLFAEGPFGSAVDVSITFANTCDWVAVGFWRVENGRPVADAAASDISQPSPTLAINAGRNGTLLGAVTSHLLSATTWSGLNEVDDFGVSGGNYSFAGRDFAADDPGHGVTATQVPATRSAPTVVGADASLSGSGFQAGDIVIMAVETMGAWSLPVGTWSLLAGAISDGATGDLYVLWQRLTGDSFSLSTATFGGDHVSTSWIVVRGAETSGNPIAAFSTGISAGAVTGISIPSVTTTRANSLVVDIAAWTQDNVGPRYSGWTNANLTGMTERTDSGTVLGNGGGTAINTGVKETPGATGATAATCAASNQQFYAKLAIHPDFSTSTAVLAVAAFEWTRPIAETRATLRFAKPADYRPQDIEAIASIADVSVTPARIKPGEDLGSRATAKVSFKDHPHPDTGPGLDPYYTERPYDPYQQGSFWSKFRARHPYLKGEELLLRQGFVGQTLDDMESSLFVVESFDGPTIDGIYTVTAHDPLKMLDGDRAQCPKVTRGRLSVDLALGGASFTIIPPGLGDVEYAASGWLNLGGKEMVSFTRTGDVFTIVRGQMGTVAADHKAGDRVQQAARFDSLDPAVIIHRLMTEFAGVPEAWIPLGDWLAETGGYLQRVFDATIAEPTAVAKLVGELMEQAGLSIWWDEIGRELRLRVLRPIATDAAMFDEKVMARQSLGIKEQPDKRFSEVWIHFGQVSPLGGEDPDNYPTVSVTTNLEAQDNYQSAKIKKIYSRWIARGGRTAADRVGRIVLARYVNPPRLFTFSLMRGAQGEPQLGEGYMVSHRSLQDATGARLPEKAQIVSLKRGATQFDLTAEGFSYDLGPDVGNRQVTIASDLFGVDLRSLHDDLYPDPNAGDTVTCIIEAQARVGGTTALPAFNVGNWPTLAGNATRSTGSAVLTGLAVDTAMLAAGILVRGTGIPAGARILSIDSPSQVTLTANASSPGTASVTFFLVNLVIENRGLIAGIGGAGGKGANDGGNSGSGGKNGGTGGTALYARYPYVYRDASGKTQAGGGGGAGAGCGDYGDHRGGGGGGGAGFPGGAAGIGPGNGEDGTAGTLTAGGAGGRSFTAYQIWSSPELKDGVKGGAGGAPGAAGANDTGTPTLSGGAPGAAGVAIDGLSFLIQDGAAGTRLGTQIN